MVRRILLVAAGAVGVTVTASPAEAQFNCWFRGDPTQVAQRPSPPDSTEVVIGGATVKLCYGAPSANGRKVMGGLVPFGAPWRLGANEATTIHLPFAAEIAGVRVDPGTYTLYVIAAEAAWEIAVNRVTQRWGVPIDQQLRARDVGTGRVSAEPLPVPVERLHMAFGPARGDAAELVVEWELTRVRIPVRRAGG